MPKDLKKNYIREHLNKLIVLVGMMGAGKTTVARHLSHLLEMDMADSDQEIEKELGVSIAEIFRTRGESHFRLLEKQKISQLLKNSPGVLSVGGGALTTPETAKMLSENAICVWLDAPVELLVQRTAGQENRPLLKGNNAAEILKARLEERRSLYEAAPIKADASYSAEAVAQNVLGQIYDYLLNTSDAERT